MPVWIMAAGAGVLGVVALVASILALVGAARERMIKKLTEDGLIKRSGPRRLRVKLDKFVGQGRRSGMRAIKPGELVLTGTGLYLLCPFVIQLSGADLSNLRMARQGARLELETDHPFEATGRVALSFDCEDVDDWLQVLGSRGAALRP